jgi:hypothetical protein
MVRHLPMYYGAGGIEAWLRTGMEVHDRWARRFNATACWGLLGKVTTARSWG